MKYSQLQFEFNMLIIHSFRTFKINIVLLNFEYNILKLYYK